METEPTLNMKVLFVVLMTIVIIGAAWMVSGVMSAPQLVE
jgi:hypothetical protein